MPQYNLGACECCGPPCDGSACGLDFMPQIIDVDMSVAKCINSSGFVSFGAQSLGPGLCTWEGRFPSPNCPDQVNGDDLLFHIYFHTNICRFEVTIMSVIYAGHIGPVAFGDICQQFLTDEVDPMNPATVDFSFFLTWQPGNQDCGCCNQGFGGGAGSGVLRIQ